MKNTIKQIEKLADQYNVENPDHKIVIALSIADGKGFATQVLTRNADIISALAMNKRSMRNFARDAFDEIGSAIQNLMK